MRLVDRRFRITREDILANLPYHPACAKWFDNHLLTDRNATPPSDFKGRYAQAPSAARVVYDHYLPEHPDLTRFAELVAETDRLDSAQLTMDDVIAPKSYILLGYTLDPRTGLGAFQDYFRRLLDALATRPAEEVLDLPDVQARVGRMREEDRAFREATLAHSRMEGSVVVTDFRPLSASPVGNRFLVYTLFPEAAVSIRLHSASCSPSMEEGATPAPAPVWSPPKRSRGPPSRSSSRSTARADVIPVPHPSTLANGSLPPAAG